MRGVVTQYHRADKSASGMSDPSPSPAGCGSDFPEPPAQPSAVSVLFVNTAAMVPRKLPHMLFPGNIPPQRDKI